MHLRKLVILLGVLSLLVSRSVLALGLGDISLNSSLNQPLDAHIGLRDLGDLSAEQIVIKLGTEEDFEKVGLERSFFYTQLRFNVVADGPNGPFVAVTSRDPVREPYLSFVVDMRWTSGRVMREYTLLLDLPTFSGETAAPVQGSVTPIESNSRPAKSEPVRQRTESGAVPAETAGSDVYGPVKASDTLWEIARDYRPGNASIHQTMLAIQQANPDAFIRNNINLLRKGQVLRIPSESEIRNLNNRQAISRVAEQNREWSGDAMGAQLDGSGRTRDNRAAPSEVSGRVRLASGSNEASDTSNPGAGSAGSEELSRELTDAKDELARTRGENSELRSRVGDLEEQIETMERLLAVSNEQMRALELAAQQEEGADTTAEDSAIAKTPAAADKAPAAKTAAAKAGGAEPEQNAKQPAEQTTAETGAQAAKPEEAQPNRNTTKVVRRAPEPTLMDKVMNNLLWIVLALVVVVLLIVFALRKRSSKAGDDDEFSSDYDEPIPYEDDESEAEFEQADAEQEQPLAEDPLFTEKDDDGDASVEAETGDVVGEADIYIALGKYDQAEEMLLAGLEREPGSVAISLKLLELYGESNNLEAFDARFAAIAEQGDQNAIARAKSLREQHFPGAAEFVLPAAVAGTAAATADDLGEDDFAQTFDLNDESEAADSQELDLDDDFDFDLSDELGDSTLDDSSESTDFEAPTGSDELELDESSSRYDLSFDEGDAQEQDDVLEFDLDLDDESDISEPTDDLSLELDDAPEAEPDAADDLELSLDDVEPMAPEDVAAPQQLDSDELADLEFDLDAISDDSGETDTDGGVSLTDEAPLLDEDFSFDTPLDLEPEEDEAPVYDEPEPYSPSAAGEPRASVALDDETSTDTEDDVPTLDLAEDEADDFDLDKAMDDFDLESMDADMAALDDADSESPKESLADAGADQAQAEPEAFDADDDDAFDQALGGLDVDESALDDAPDFDSLAELDDDSDVDDEDLDFLTDSDEVTTKLDLARAYIDMGDLDGARDILAEVAEEGNDEQKAEANSLLEKAQG